MKAMQDRVAQIPKLQQELAETKKKLDHGKRKTAGQMQKFAAKLVAHEAKTKELGIQMCSLLALQQSQDANVSKIGHECAEIKGKVESLEEFTRRAECTLFEHAQHINNQYNLYDQRVELAMP